MTDPRIPPGPRNPGDAWVTASDGNRYWGRFGAAGLLVHDPARGVLLQHRVDWSDHGGTWGIPGGARHEGESAVDGAKRETLEEAGVPLDATRVRFTHVLDRGGWTYTTVITEVTRRVEAEITDAESHELAWVPIGRVTEVPLHPGFAASWPLLRTLLGGPPALIIDAANVVGSVPNGWWRDRAGAAVRLRDRVASLAATGVPAGMFGLDQALAEGIDRAYPDLVLVVEGAAHDTETRPGVEVVAAPGLGDDTIVEEARRRAAGGRRVTVVTADEELRVRVRAAGALTRRPRKLLRLLPDD